MSAPSDGPAAWQSPGMEFASVVRARRMVRAYRPGPSVPDAVLCRVLDAAIRAPSAGFSQGWDFVVCRRPTDVDRFWGASLEPGDAPDSWLAGIRTAPILVLCLSDPEHYLERYAEPDKGWDEPDRETRLAHWPIPYWDVDTGMAALLMLLAAVDEGLGACFFGIPPDGLARFRAEFGVPEEYRPI